jgi:hypothetical protein
LISFNHNAWRAGDLVAIYFPINPGPLPISATRLTSEKSKSCIPEQKNNVSKE